MLLCFCEKRHWGTQPAEEQHGSIAVMHKYNGELAAHHLCLRSFIHSARFLCVRPDNAFARHTEMAVKRLEKKQPGKVRGQHMFAADAVAAARRQLGPASPVTFDGFKAGGDTFCALILCLAT